MSPSGSTSSTRNATTPYTRPRGAVRQPKSSRQQFSACGACRMRRVKCNLKDLPAANISGQKPSCSNCSVRGIKCVDEYAEVKAAKLSQAISGKVTNELLAIPTPTNTASIISSSTLHQPSVIPQLELEFLKSPFFRRFSVQRPIIEPTEFTTRYLAHVKGSASLGIEGEILAMLLIAWAASFGVNEYGAEEEQEPMSPTHSVGSNTSVETSQDNDPRRRARIAYTEAMVKEILGLIDTHGVLRHPTWDGVRILLLILPLTRGVQAPMDRQTMYEATLSQIYSLCRLANPSTVNSGQGPYRDALVRCRIFWYAHAHEGITTGLHGGRLFLDKDDLIAFKATLPLQVPAPAAASTSASAASSLPSLTFPLPGDSPPSALRNGGHTRTSHSYLLTSYYFSLVLDVSSICRSIHANLTGTHIRRRANTGAGVNEENMMEIWNELEQCWDQFEGLRLGAGRAGAMGGGLINDEDIERFVSGWQVFIFECHNVIREALKQIISQSLHGSPAPNASSGATHPPAMSQTYVSTVRLHDFAIRRCRQFLPRVLVILKRHLASSESGFFTWDAGLIHDGCFFAGLLLAQGELGVENNETKVNQKGGEQWDVDVDEGVELCLRALREMGWAFSKGAEREKTLRSIWENRVAREKDIKSKRSRGYVEQQQQRQQQVTMHYSRAGQQNQTLTLLSVGGQYPDFQPLSVDFSYMNGDSSTAATDDEYGVWSTYTSPTASRSHRSSSLSISSCSPTPPAGGPLHLPQHKNYADESYNGLHRPSFSADNASNSCVASPAWSPAYNHHQRQERNHMSPPSGYLDPNLVFSRPGAVLTSDGSSDNGFPHFGSDRRGFYH